MIKAIEKLNMEPGDEIGISFKGMPVTPIQIPGGKTSFSPLMISAVFKRLIVEDDSAVILVDMGGENRLIHTAVALSEICQICKASEIATN